jgi:SAM-dependent methyltransferase
MPDFDSVALNYDHLLNAGLSATGETKEFFARGRVTRLRQRLAELGHAAHAVLDFGCGPGSTTGLLRSLLGAKQVIGLDVSEGLLEVAKRESRDPAVTFVTPDSWPSGVQVDLAYCNGVFHHIAPAERPEYVQFIRRVLRPNGILALWENNPWNPGTRLVMSRIPFDRTASLLTASSAVQMLRREGFTALGVDYAFIFPRVLKALRPLETWLSSWPIGGQYQILARR